MSKQSANGFGEDRFQMEGFADRSAGGRAGLKARISRRISS
jgi:hypothetical protein